MTFVSIPKESALKSLCDYVPFVFEYFFLLKKYFSVFNFLSRSYQFVKITFDLIRFL